jgi:hypothetical protein
MLYHDTAKRHCAFCGELFRPSRPTQKYCRYFCYCNGRAAEGRAMRRVWQSAGRPMLGEGKETRELTEGEGALF